MKKLTKIFAMAILMALFAACSVACSVNSSSYSAFDRGGFDVIDNSETQLYRRSADLTLRTKQSKLQEASDKVSEKSKEFGAIVGYMNSNGDEDGLYRVSYSFAIDNDKVTDFVAAVKALGYKVEYENMSVTNVTEDFSQQQAQIASLTAQIEMLKQMQQDSSLSVDEKIKVANEIIEAESKLASVKSGYGGTFSSGKSRVSVQVLSDSYSSGGIDDELVLIILLLAITPIGVIAVIVILAIGNGKQRRKLTELQIKLAAAETAKNHPTTPDTDKQ